jgi:RNA polymerase sigma-70 factor (ECF subfamily)
MMFSGSYVRYRTDIACLHGFRAATLSDAIDPKPSGSPLQQDFSDQLNWLSMLLSTQKKALITVTESVDLAALMAKIQQGDEIALQDFYDATVKRVYSSAMRITANPADAADVACEIYLRLWLTAYRYDASRGSPSQWLMVIVRNCALDCLRQRRRANRSIGMASYEELAQPSPAPLPEQQLQQDETASLIQHELSKLPTVQGRLVRLAFFEGLTHSEISAREQLPLGTVKSQINRALMKLRVILDKLDPTYAFVGSERS